MVINTNLLAQVSEFKVFCSFDCTEAAIGEVEMPDGQKLPICAIHRDLLLDNTESN